MRIIFRRRFNFFDTMGILGGVTITNAGHYVAAFAFMVGIALLSVSGEALTA